MSTAELLNAAVRAHQSGNLQLAENIYRKILADDPNQPDALHLLGVVAYQSGHSEAAIELIRRAIEQMPTCAAYHNNLGEALRQMERYGDAEACYRRAIELDAGYLDAKNNLGIALQKQGKFAEAKRQYVEVLKANPGHASAHLNIGSLHQQSGNHAAAIAAYAKALEIDPNFPQAHNNLGTIAHDEGRLADAMHHYNLAAKVAPRYADVYYNRGNVLKLTHRLDQAAADYQRALELQPSFTLAAQRLADTFAEMGETDNARSVLNIHASKQGNWLLQFRADILCPPLFASAQQLEDYRTRLDQTLDRYRQQPPAVTLDDLLQSGCEPPFALQFHGRNELGTRRKFAELFAGACRSSPELSRRSGQIRLGFVVTDFHELAFAKSMLGVLNGFTQDIHVDILCSLAGSAALHPQVNNVRIHLRPLPTRPADRPQAIAAGSYDLLYYWEVGTDSQNYFLPFLRLAPVQGTSWGIQLTTGIPNMDFYLSSSLVESSEAHAHYSERLLLGRTLLTRQPSPVPAGEDWHDPKVKDRWRHEFGFAAGESIYAIAQQLGKFHPDFDRLLAGILETDLSARIVITGDKSPKITSLLADRFQHSLGSRAARITFLPRLTGAAYFGLLTAADVLLDPVHFGGVNSTYDGLALGKPIVTLPSPYQRGRLTYGCYQKMGIQDCIAGTEEDYVRIAVSLGTDRERRQELSQRLRTAAVTLFDDVQASQETERILIDLASVGRRGS